MLAGRDFGGFSEKAIQKSISSTFVNQYDEHALPRYLASDPAERVVIVDDWHTTRYNTQGEAIS